MQAQALCEHLYISLHLCVFCKLQVLISAQLSIISIVSSIGFQ